MLLPACVVYLFMQPFGQYVENNIILQISRAPRGVLASRWCTHSAWGEGATNYNISEFFLSMQMVNQFQLTKIMPALAAYSDSDKFEVIKCCEVSRLCDTQQTRF